MTIEHLPIPLERDGFLRDLIRELSGTLQDVVGSTRPQASSASSVSVSATRSTKATAKHCSSLPYRNRPFPVARAVRGNLPTPVVRDYVALWNDARHRSLELAHVDVKRRCDSSWRAMIIAVWATTESPRPRAAAATSES